MIWCAALIPLLLQCVVATFPPVSNPPPIPSHAVRSVDISGQRFYVPDDLQINPPQTVLKEESYLPPLPPDPKVDDQRWFVYENQSGETSDFPTSTETFDRYYSNGLPAVGPVATPVPDDTYIAQPSGTSKVIPESPANIGPSDIWVLSKGPDDQYASQRWVQLQMPQERISQVVNSDQFVPGTLKAIPSLPLQQINNAGSPVSPSNVMQQVWIRTLPQDQSQKVYQNTAPTVADLPLSKQNVNFPVQPIKQYVQTGVVQDPQLTLPPSPPNVISQKSSGFILPSPLPQTFKGGDLTPTQQSVVVSQPAVYKGGDISSPNLQPVLVNQQANYKGLDMTSPNQAILVNQPGNYKGVDITSPNQAVIISQPANYKGVDVAPPNQAILVKQPANYNGVDITAQNQAVLVNQPQNYKGVDINPPSQAVLVNQPINYKGVDISSPNQAVFVNQPDNYKGVDITSPNQALLINQPASYKGGDVTSPKQMSVITQSQIGLPVAKNGVLGQVRHIWIPTSQQTGKFITVPVASVVDSGKSVPSKGVPINSAPPISVSGTWVLKQDGSLPRFEPQRTFPTQVIQKGGLLGTGTVLQFDSPKNTPLLGKSVDPRVPVNAWANSKDFQIPTLITRSVIPSSPFPIPTGKAGSGVVGKSGPILNISPQKTYSSGDKGIPLQPLPAPTAPQVVQVTRGKPCLTGPQKSLISPKAIPYPVYRSTNPVYRPMIAVNRQSLPRILRLNRYPYGSYYVLNPRMGPGLYAYPRPQAQAPVIQQSKNGLVRILSAKQIGVPSKQVYISVPRKQVALPAAQIKSISPGMQTQFVFPPIQAVNSIRYAYPRGSFLRSIPAAGKNVFIFPPPGKKTKPETLQSSSSESSSSESSSSESKSLEVKPESKEEIGEAKSEASPESAEPKSERETEDVEAAASEPDPESKEASAPTSEASESTEAAESEANSAS